MSTLTDTLRELSELLPERFKYEHECWYALRWGTWRKVSLIARIDEDRIMGACLEECRERNIGWSLQTTYVSGGTSYRATLYPRRWNLGSDTPFSNHRSDWLTSPAEAISTALLEAIKNERGGAEK